jgi:ketosteroid isomerase-like protein
MYRLRFIMLLGAIAATTGCRNEDSPLAPAPGEEALRAVVQLETRKWDLFFGSAADRQQVMSYYAEDFVNVGYGPAGVARQTRAEMAAGIGMFPQLPAGSFSLAEMRTIPAGGGGVVLSYRITGPGPTGPDWTAYVVSVWARRDGEWKTIYYQATS